MNAAKRARASKKRQIKQINKETSLPGGISLENIIETVGS